MRVTISCLAVVAMLLFAERDALASTESFVKILKVYGPGGPHHVLEECATLFEEQHEIDVVVIKALPHELARKLPEDGDIYYGGAEYMLVDFARDNPGVLDLSTAANLHPRRIGIVVRKGNPLKIDGLADLRREGVDILDVKLESMRHFHGTPGPGRMSNVRHHVYTGKQGVDAWRAKPEIDAWVTYRSWHVALVDEADFIAIPGKNAVRFTPVALTHRTPHRQEAMNFLNFLRTDEARRIFEEHGWN